jgi:hypothetical protein
VAMNSGGHGRNFDGEVFWAWRGKDKAWNGGGDPMSQYIVFITRIMYYKRLNQTLSNHSSGKTP